MPNYLPSYAYDIFVSYAHADNEGRIPWVSRFVTDLKTVLKQRLGSEPAVFLDTRVLQGNEQLEAMKDMARKSALFVPIVSPSYVSRQWPLAELEAFLSGHGPGGRVFSVDLLPLDSEADYPPALRELVRKKLFAETLDERVPMPMEPNASKDASGFDLYHLKVVDFALKLKERLKQLRDGTEGQTVWTASPERTHTVILGQVTDDLEGERDRLASHLGQYGIAVLPSGGYPQGGREFESAFAADCQRAAYFVQLLGPLARKRPQDLPEGYAAHQYRVAKNTGLTAFLWRRPEMDHRAIATHPDAKLFSSPELRTGGFEEFKKWIVDTVRKPPVEPPPRPRNSFVFIDSDLTDLELAKTLGRGISNRSKPVFLPTFAGESHEILDDLKDNMVDCQALVVVYGRAQPSWVRAQLRLCTKLRGGEPPKVLAVYTGPPDEKADLELSIPHLRMIDARRDNVDSAVEEIVAALDS